jgi:transposase-like protein
MRRKRTSFFCGAGVGKVADDCLIELRWLYDRRNAEEARRDRRRALSSFGRMRMAWVRRLIS